MVLTMFSRNISFESSSLNKKNALENLVDRVSTHSRKSGKVRNIVVQPGKARENDKLYIVKVRGKVRNMVVFLMVCVDVLKYSIFLSIICFL